MADSTASPQVDSALPEPQAPSPSSAKPKIIGLYGLPGCGKSYLLNRLKQELDAEHFEFQEGSAMIDSIVVGGLEAFKKLEDQVQMQWRQLAIDYFANGCTRAGDDRPVGVVAGHFMFWDEGEEMGRVVWTQNDAQRYTHIIYLDIESDTILQRRLDDTDRSRSFTSEAHLRRWQEAEMAQLRQLCRDNGILFAPVRDAQQLQRIDTFKAVSQLLQDFRIHTEESNLFYAKARLDEYVQGHYPQLHTMLVIDGDRTLAAEDTGNLFWGEVIPGIETTPLNELFSSQLGYSYTSFRQAVLLHEERFHDRDSLFDTFCGQAARLVKLRQEFHWLLCEIHHKKHIGVVVVTCGLRLIWEKILDAAGLSSMVMIIGGGRLKDRYVVTPEVKASLVSHLRTVHKLYVWAFGDSPLDLPMLARADEAIVVVGDEESRSKSMDAALTEAVNTGGLRARQVLLPRHEPPPPRGDIMRLPIIDLFRPEFVDPVMLELSYNMSPGLQIFHATERQASKLLATRMRNAMVTGPSLRMAHELAGWYLATEFLTTVIGLEDYPITHVQGHTTNGYGLRYEERTLIVPLMRGGEAMAFGVNEAFHLARFVHANRPDDITHNHIQGMHNVILVDSVINSGKTIVEFARHVRELRPTTRVVVVAGVVQNQSISEGGLIHEYGLQAELELVALRVSENKFTGKGGTDTGNRLFHTTHLE